MPGTTNAVEGPEAAPYLAKSGGTMTGAINMGTSQINALADPTLDQDAATKKYVDDVAIGLNIQPAVRVATDTALTVTYANGTAGVGATLTNAGTQVALVIDGVTLSVADRVLVKNQASTFQNGIYTVTNVGSGATNWVMTRATDYDQVAEIQPGDFVIVNQGSANTGSGWIETVTVVTIGTDPILFSQFSSQLSIGQENLIIGGNFDTNPWQRGTTFTSVINGQITADRMKWSIVGTGVVDNIKTADAPTVTEAGIFSSNCYEVNVTTADAAIDALDQYYWQYRMEGYDWAQLAQRTFTVSFWVKFSKAGIYSLGVASNGDDRGYVAEYTVNAANTWEKKVITISASPSSGTWNYTNGIGLFFKFSIAVGSNYKTSSLNTWNTGAGQPYASTNQVNGMDTIGNNFRFQLIKVEPGAAATPWRIQNAEEVLSFCQRYYQKTFNQGVTPAQNSGTVVGALTYQAAVTGATSNGILWQFSVPMRTTPALTAYNPNAANTLWRNATDAADSGASSFVNAGDRSVFVANAQVAGDGAGETLNIHADANAEL